jgi:tubulin-specific chaperone D
MSRALVGYVKTLPLAVEGDTYDLLTFLDDLLGRITANAGSNKVVLPIFQTFHLLLEEGCLTPVADDEGGLKR